MNHHLSISLSLPVIEKSHAVSNSMPKQSKLQTSSRERERGKERELLPLQQGVIELTLEKSISGCLYPKGAVAESTLKKKRVQDSSSKYVRGAVSG